MKRPENGRGPRASGRLAVVRADAGERAGGPVPPALLAELQTGLHQALRALASGAIVSPLGTWRGWARARCHPSWVSALAGIEAMRARLPGAAAVTPPGADPTLTDAAAVLARGYAALREAIGTAPGAPGPGPLAPMPMRPGYALAPVRALCGYLEANCGADIRAAYVHGSHSTGDFNAYSDLDTLVVLRAEAATDPARLLACAIHLLRSCRYLLQCDLLQHHGHFVLTEIDFDWYCDAHFPLVLFPHSTQIVGDGTLGVTRIRDSSREAREQLESMCRRFLGPDGSARLGSAFELKLYLSCFMILPSLLLQIRGQPCYKRESFERARAWYAPEEYAVMDAVSELRRRWRQAAPGAWARLAALSPVLRGALVYRRGRWGVPADIFAVARDPSFQARMRDFAARTLELAGDARAG